MYNILLGLTPFRQRGSLNLRSYFQLPERLGFGLGCFAVRSGVE